MWLVNWLQTLSRASPHQRYSGFPASLLNSAYERCITTVARAVVIAACPYCVYVNSLFTIDARNSNIILFLLFLLLPSASRQIDYNKSVFSLLRRCNMILLAFAADRRAAVHVDRACCCNRSISPARRTHSSKPAARGCGVRWQRSYRYTDRACHILRCVSVMSRCEMSLTAVDPYVLRHGGHLSQY